MAKVALSTTVLTFLGSYIFYTLWFVLSPGDFPDSSSLQPTLLEWVWMGSTTLAALIISVVFSIKLAQRILTPLNSVVDNLRHVAQGDLSVRAVTNDPSLGEASQLVRDFNVMAERLERMERDRSFWNAAIAHELRTPVTILRGRLQGLTDGVFEPSPSLFQSLLAQVEGLTRLIEDLRLVGLADSGHLELRQEDIDLDAEVKAVLQAVEPSLSTAGFHLTCELQGGRAVCDPVRIRQGLLALLENAQRHATPGPLWIRTRQEQGICHVQVEDSGPGIPESLSGKIFEAFQRGENGTKGSGLGLAVVQAIGKAHGGDALCIPTPNGGTLFDLSWPGLNSERSSIPSVPR